MRWTMGFSAVLLVLVCVVSADATATVPYRLDHETYVAAIRESAGHPNELSRWRGLWSYSSQRYSEARKHFERAAYHGDKPSQYLLSVMHLHGEGGGKDPVAAYIWADLAAERGAREVLRIREQIWQSLDAAQKRQVEEAGPGYYERYGDPVAMRRTNTKLIRFSRHRTGSRTGSDTGKLGASLGGMSSFGFCTTDTSKLKSTGRISDIYASNRTDIDAYWREQEFVLRNIALGTVIVGGVEPVRAQP